MRMLAEADLSFASMTSDLGSLAWSTASFWKGMVPCWSLGFAPRKTSNMGDLGCPVPKV